MKKVAFSFILLVCAACQQPTTYAPRITQEELHREELAQQQLVDKAAEQGGMPRPWRNRPEASKQFETVADRIDKAGAQLCKDMGLPQQGRRCYYYFELSRSRQLNSHADGTTVVIYSGMMRFLQDDDEVAIITAHELAHNLMGHLDAQKQNATVGLLFGALLDGVSASQGVHNRNDDLSAGAELGRLTYSVEFEEEADYVGLYIAARAGYDIRKAAGIWRRLTLEDPKGLFNGYDHPSNAKRVIAMEKAVAEIEYKRQHHLALVPELKSNMQENPPASGNN